MIPSAQEQADQRRASGSDSPTRQQLVDAARRIIERDGVAAATSRAISEQADANLGAITYYFGSKDALIAEALAELGRALLGPVIEALTSAESPLEQLQTAVGLLPAILEDHPDAVHGYVHALSAAAHEQPVREALAELHREITETLRDQIARHQASGIVPQWVDGDAMAALIVALVNGVAVTEAAGVDTCSPTELGAQFGALLLHAALPPNPPD